MAKRGRPPHPDILTPREWEVLDCIRDGLSNEQIAERLGISFDGAKYHVTEILTKLGLENRHDAARWRPEEHAPALAPLLFLRRLPARWLSPAIIGGLAVGIAAGAGLLVWALMAAGGGNGAAAALTLPPGDRLAYVGTDSSLWLREADGRSSRLTDGSLDDASPLWSPNGQYILFIRSTRFPPGIRSHPAPFSSLWLADLQSGDVRRFGDIPSRLNDNQGAAAGAQWSPDSERVAFLAQTGHDVGDAVWLQGLQGPPRQIVPPMEGLLNIAWSPDGEQIALAITHEVGYLPELGPDSPAISRDNGVYVVNVESGIMKAVALQPTIAQAYGSGEPARPGDARLSDLGVAGPSNVRWSSDGKFLAFQASVLSASASSDGEALFTVPADGATLVYHGIMLLPPALLDWFPNSHHFAFTLGNGRDMYWGKRIALAEAGVPGATVIAEDPDRVLGLDINRAPISARSDGWPAISLDGSRIAFQASAVDTSAMPRMDVGKIEGPKEGIWIVEADGSNPPRQLTSDPNYLDFFPEWSADGQYIIFVRTDGRQFVSENTPDPNAHAEIWIMRSDGSDAKPLVSDLQRIGSYYGFFGWDQDFAWYRHS